MGYYGHQNTGDDALAYAMAKCARRALPESSITALTKRKITLPKDLKIKQDISEGVPLAHKFSWRLSILRSDHLIRGGGGIIFHHRLHRPHPTNLTNIRKVHEFAKAMGRSVSLAGISVGPLDTEEARAEALKILESADFISVRDSDSMAILRSLGIPSNNIIKCLDPAIILAEDIDFGPTRLKDLCIGVALRPLFSWMESSARKEDAYHQSLAGSLGRVLQKYSDARVRLFIFHAGSASVWGDEEVTYKLAADLRRFESRVEVVPYLSNPLEAISEIAKCSHVFAVRYHAAVFAYMTGVPFLIADYQGKCRGFAADIALDHRYVIDLDDLVNQRILDERLMELVETESLNCLDLDKAIAEAWKCLPGQFQRRQHAG